MTDPRALSIDARTVTRWKFAIFAIFLASGLSIATWAARVPDIREGIEVDRAAIGILLLIGGIGSITGLSLSSLEYSFLLSTVLKTVRRALFWACISAPPNCWFR